MNINNLTYFIIPILGLSFLTGCVHEVSQGSALTMSDLEQGQDQDRKLLSHFMPESSLLDLESMRGSSGYDEHGNRISSNMIYKYAEDNNFPEYRFIHFSYSIEDGETNVIKLTKGKARSVDPILSLTEEQLPIEDAKAATNLASFSLSYIQREDPSDKVIGIMSSIINIPTNELTMINSGGIESGTYRRMNYKVKSATDPDNDYNFWEVTVSEIDGVAFVEKFIHGREKLRDRRQILEETVIIPESN